MGRCLDPDYRSGSWSRFSGGVPRGWACVEDSGIYPEGLPNTSRGSEMPHVRRVFLLRNSDLCRRGYAVCLTGSFFIEMFLVWRGLPACQDLHGMSLPAVVARILGPP